MCDLMTGIGVGLSAIQTFSGIDAQNDASAVNRAAALQASNDENASSTSRFIEDNRSLIQGGFDAILEGRSNESAAYASAIQNGVQGASVKAVLRDQKQKAGRNAARNEQERDSLATQASANLKHINAKARSRINSVPTTSFGLGDAVGILAPIVRSQTD